MEIGWLQDLVALAQHLNFSRAAQARNLTQPAFSRRIRSLEEWAGVSVVDRHTHPVSITPSGTILLAMAYDVIRRLERGRQEANDAIAMQTTLRFASTQALSQTFFSDWLRSLGPLVASAPMSLLVDNMTGCERLMAEGKADFLLCHYHPLVERRLTSSDLIWTRLGSDVLLPVSRRQSDGDPLFRFPGAADDPPPLLAFDERSGMGQIIAAALPRLGPAACRVVFTSHLAVVLKTLAVDGKGIAWTTLRLAREDLGPGGSLAQAADASWRIPIDIILARRRAGQSQFVEDFWQAVVRSTA